MTPQTPQQLAVCSWSLRAAGASDLAQKVGACGLKQVQLGLSAHRDDPGAWEGVQETLDRHGIAIVSGMFGAAGEDYSTLQSIRRTGGVVPDEHWEQNWRIVNDAAALARRLGLKLVSSHLGFLPEDHHDPAFDKLAGRIARIARLLADHGLELLFETGQETADTLVMCLEELERRGASNVGVNFDPANMILYGMGDPVASLEKLLPRVKQVHLKDAVRTKVPGTWGSEAVVGEGEVDWPRFLDVLARGGYRGHLVFEREAGDDRTGDIGRGRRFIQRLMK